MLMPGVGMSNYNSHCALTLMPFGSLGCSKLDRNALPTLMKSRTVVSPSTFSSVIW